MKLIYYELSKVLNKRIFYIFLVLCFVINSAVFCMCQNTPEKTLRLEYSKKYEEIISDYSKLPIDKAQGKINREIKNNTLQTTYMYPLLNRISGQIEYVKSYPEFIGNMKKRADEQAKIWNNSSFTVKNLYKTAEDYEHLKSTKLRLINAEPVTSAISFNTTDFFIIAVIFATCIYLFGYERENALYPLVKSTEKGRLKTVISKLTALLIITAVTSLIFTSLNFITAVMLYGTTDLSASVQSILQLRNCIYPVTVLEFEMLFTLVKILGAVLISIIITTLFIVFSNAIMTCIVGIVFMGFEYLSYILIQPDTALKLLKYINVFYIFDSDEFLGQYQNIDIFSNPVPPQMCVIIVFLFLSAVFSILSCIIFCKQPQYKKSVTFLKLNEKFQINLCSTSLLQGELYKYLIHNKMLIAILLLTLYAVFSSTGNVSYPYTCDSDYQYKQYMECLSGPLTSEKEQYITKEKSSLKELEKQIAQINNDSNLTQNEKQSLIKTNQSILDSKQEAFDKVLHQYKHLKKLKSKAVDASFIDENIYSNFTSNSQREWNNFIISGMLIIIFIPSIFTSDYKNGIINLLRSTQKGKSNLFNIKLLISNLALIYIYISVNLPYIIRFINTYGTTNFSTRLVCLYSNLPQTNTLTIFRAFLLAEILYFAIAFLIMSIVLFVSQLTKSNLHTLIIGSVFLIAIGAACKAFDSLRIGYLIVNDNIISIALILVMCLIFSLLSIFFSKRKFTNSATDKLHILYR